MNRFVLVIASTLTLACAAVAPVALGAAATAGVAAAQPTVTVQVKSLTKTLLRPTQAHGRAGWITKGGTPKGKCPASSAAGALDAATHGRWTGTYYTSVSGIFIDSILGVKPPGKDYWGVFIGKRAASSGICAIKLHAGEQLLFKIVK